MGHVRVQHIRNTYVLCDSVDYDNDVKAMLACTGQNINLTADTVEQLVVI